MIRPLAKNISVLRYWAQSGWPDFHLTGHAHGLLFPFSCRYGPQVLSSWTPARCLRNSPAVVKEGLVPLPLGHPAGVMAGVPWGWAISQARGGLTGVPAVPDYLRSCCEGETLEAVSKWLYREEKRQRSGRAGTLVLDSGRSSKRSSRGEGSGAVAEVFSPDRPGS